MTTLSARFPPTPLGYARGQNLEPGLAELVQQSAGNLATLKGHTSGAALIGGIPNPAPVNPSGDYGHDHSGGEYGRPLFRSVASMTFDNGSLGSAIASSVNEGPVFTLLSIADGADSTTTRSGTYPFWIWVPPCDPDPAVGGYARLGVAFRLRVFSSALIAGDTATLRFWRRDPLSTGQVVQTLSISTPETTGVKATDGGTSTLVSVRPGAFNEINVQVEVVRTTGGSSRGADLYLLEAEFGVWKTWA